MSLNEIRILDRGRGPQLSTSRVTVQDLIPYFQDGCPHEEIMRWVPSLSSQEIDVVEQYYRDHQMEMDEADRLLRARNAENKNSASVERVLEEAHRERLAFMESLRQTQVDGAPR